MKTVTLSLLAFSALFAGTARAEDPVSLLTRDDEIAQIIRQATPEVPAVTLTTAIRVDAADKPVAAPVKSGPGKVELAAIYFYAEQKQDARVKAEFARLKYKYPDFEMPDDLYKPKVERIDEKLLWALYNKDDIIGVGQEIARRQAENPGWTPTDDFTAKFARKKMRNAIVASHKVKNWQGVLAAGASLKPETEKEVDLLWNMIDAYAASGNKQALGHYYRAILFRDAGHALPKPAIIATIQKATRDFAPADVRAVMAQFATDPEISAGLASVSVDLIRKSVADFNADKTQTAALAGVDVEALKTAAQSADGKTDDLSLLGWYYLKVKEPAEAGAWFRRALDKEADVEHAKGLYLSLVQQDRQDEAYELALKYKGQLASDPVFLMNALAERFTKPDSGKIDAEAVKAYAGTILSTKSADHAEILAWYAYNSGQFQASRAWFGKAFGWEPKPTRLKGLALSEGQLGDRAALVALYDRYANQYADIWDDVHLNKSGKKTTRKKQTFIDEMQVGAVDRKQETRPDFISDDETPANPPVRRKKIVAAPPANTSGYAGMLASKRYGACVASLQAAEAKGRLSADASLVKGWCMLGLNRTAEAKAAFSGALSGGGKTRADAAYGLSLTLLRGRLTADAESVIALYPLTPARDKEIRLEIYWQKARSSFDHKQYQRTLDALNARIALTPEPTDMTQLRAWAHFNLGHVAEARTIFQKLAAYIDDAGVRRGLAATGDSSFRVN